MQTIDSPQRSPTGPATSGIVYLPAAGILLVTGTEVIEMPIYAGINVFEKTLLGIQVDTRTKLVDSNEPKQEHRFGKACVATVPQKRRL